MHEMLARLPDLGGTTRHDVSGRIDGRAASKCAIQYPVEGRDVKPIRQQFTLGLLQEPPGLDLVEELKQQDAKDGVSYTVGATIDHPADQVLANAIGRTVRVGELVGGDDGIDRPRRRFTPHAPEKYILPLYGEAPVRIKHGTLRRWTAGDDN